MKSSAIKHTHNKDDLLTDHAIQDIPLKLVYQWVKTGAWSQTDFLRWAKACRLDWHDSKSLRLTRIQNCSLITFRDGLQGLATV